MSLLDDLNDYKLETSFQNDPQCILHTSYRADRARGISKVAIVHKWIPQKPYLGAGTFGIVRLEELVDKEDGDKNGRNRQRRAVKLLHKPFMQRTRFDYKKELLALTKFSRSKFAQSQLFVEFLGWFEDEDTIFLAMEYFPMGTLDKFIGEDLKEGDAKVISAQLLEGLKIMHGEGFTHRDLKPQNIFVVQHSPSWWIKIGDFGISKRVSNDDTALHTATGTPYYLAPEVHHYIEDANSETGTYTNAVDIWSFGCVVYQIMALHVPFSQYPRNLVAFCKGSPFPEPPCFVNRTSREGIEFIKSVLVPLPTLRPSADEAIKSKWFHPEVNPKRSSLDQMKGRQLDIENFHPLSTSIMLPDLSHKADLTPQFRVMPEIIQPLTTTKVSLEDDFHPPNPFLLSSSPLSSLVRQNRANLGPGIVKRTDTEGTSTSPKDSAGQASGALHQVGSNPASKVAKSTEKPPFPFGTEFSLLNFDTWVSRDFASTISPATVEEGGYDDLDGPPDKVPKGENHGFDGSYSKHLSSAEFQTKTFKGLVDMSDEQPIYNDGQRPPLNDDDLLRAYNSDHDESQPRPSISYDEFVGASAGAHNSMRIRNSSFKPIPERSEKISRLHHYNMRQRSGMLQKNDRRFNEVWSDEQDQGDVYVHADHGETGVNGSTTVDGIADIGTRRFTAMGLPNVDVGLNGTGTVRRKKKFGLLRRMFGLDD